MMDFEENDKMEKFFEKRSIWYVIKWWIKKKLTRSDTITIYMYDGEHFIDNSEEGGKV